MSEAITLGGWLSKSGTYTRPPVPPGNALAFGSSGDMEGIIR
jgi:hypothetical protein